MLASGGDPPLRRRPFTLDVCAHVTWCCAILIVTHRDSSSPIIFISTEFYYDNYIKAAKIKRKRIFAYFFSLLSLLVRCKGWFVLLFVQANRERYSWDICIAKRYMFVQYYNELRHFISWSILKEIVLIGIVKACLKGKNCLYFWYRWI